METIETFLVNTEFATKGLFDLLRNHESQKWQSLNEMQNANSEEEFKQHVSQYNSMHVSREVIAGSILQIAFQTIKLFGKPKEKNKKALNFESQMNRLILENPNCFKTKKYSLPRDFVVGRYIESLPIGIIIYAARNQYNHFDDKKLKRGSDVIFNYLHMICPDPKNGLSFDTSDNNQFYSYSVLAILGWLDNNRKNGYEKYMEDISEITAIKPI